jgi:hypothetical protein
MRRTLWLALALLPHAPLPSYAQSDAVIVEACVGPTGQLRLAGDGCRASERPFSWQNGGGVWVHDAEGRPLGRSMDRDGFWIHLDATGLRVWINAFTGIPQTRSLLFFTERDCQGFSTTSVNDAPGDVIADPPGPALLVATERILPSVTVRSELLFASSCRNLTAPRVLGNVRELAALDESALGFVLPAALPLHFGTGPLGPIEEEIVGACLGLGGQLRLAEAEETCRPSERSLAWQRLGGLRVYDGTGRDVGAALGSVASRAEIGILLRAGAGWIEPDPLTGVLAPINRFHAERDCEGQAFVFDFWLRNAGQVFPDDTPGEFIVAAAENVRDMPYSSVRSGSGVCSNQSGLLSGGHPLVPYDGPMPELPLPVPLVVGFPGSPLANPEGPAIPLGFVDVCAGPDGQLRVIEEGALCRGSQRGLRWPRRGGLRALDAQGRELGAFLENPDPDTPVSSDAMVIIDDTSGYRFAVRVADGNLEKEFPGGALGDIGYTGPSCTGTPFLSGDARVGFVFPFVEQLWVGTRIEPLQLRSVRQRFGCQDWPTFPGPFLSTRIEPFTGVAPFALPVATPLRVGPGN